MFMVIVLVSKYIYILILDILNISRLLAPIFYFLCMKSTTDTHVLNDMLGRESVFFSALVTSSQILGACGGNNRLSLSAARAAHCSPSCHRDNAEKNTSSRWKKERKKKRGAEDQRRNLQNLGFWGVGCRSNSERLPEASPLQLRTARLMCGLCRLMSGVRTCAAPHSSRVLTAQTIKKASYTLLCGDSQQVCAVHFAATSQTR